VFARAKEETRELGFGDWGIRKLGVPISHSPNLQILISQYLNIPLFLREGARALELSQSEFIPLFLREGAQALHSLRVS